jgi:CheY-like chemotaxis protein
MNDLEKPDKRPLAVLLIDDDDVDAKSLERAFRKAKIGNTIMRAMDGIEALEMLKGANGRTKPPSPRILLVDLNMPRMNGIEFVRALRKDEELHRSIVFILTTSKRDEDKLAAYNLNVAGYIAKAMAEEDIQNLVSLLDSYGRIVELP